MKKLLAAILVLTALSSFAAEERVIIEADNVTSTDETVYHAIGNVKIFQGERTMLADEVFYFKDLNYLEAIDNVRMTENGEVIDCTRMEYDTEKKTGVFYNADAFMEPYNWFKAKEAYKTGENSYTLKKARYTTCSGDDPSWTISASTADINVGGYLSAFNVSGWAKSVPVFYSPYIIYPIKTERESGFLIPTLGTSSKDGLFIQPQFFWNINVDKDMTFAALVSQKSDTLYANEFRMRPGTDSNFYNYIEYTEQGYEIPDDNPDTENISHESGRYFIYNKSNLKITDNTRLYIDLETVSDFGYLGDYEDYSLLKEYNNDDDDYINNIQLGYTSRLSNINLRYNDTMNYSVSTVYRKEHTYLMPSITAEQDISGLPVNLRYYVSYDKVRNTKLTHYYSTSTDVDRELNYTRNHINLMLYKPLPVYLGILTPYVKMHYTKWYDIDSNYNLTLPSDNKLSSFASLETDGDTITRKIYTLGGSLSFNEIYKDYPTFKHSIYNIFSYIQTPKVNQTYLFNYAYEDNIAYNKKYVYTLQNFFRAKNWFLKVVNAQPYVMTRQLHRFDPLVSRIDYNYSKLFSFTIEDEFNHYNRQHVFMTMNSKLRFNSVVLSAIYTYDQDTSDDQNTTLSTSITYTTPKYDLSYTRTSSGWNKELSFKTESSIDDSLTIDYKSECWQLGLIYSRSTEIDNIAYGTDSTTEHTVMLRFGLRGMGQYLPKPSRNDTLIDGDNNE